MSAAGWIVLLAALMSPAFTAAHNHSETTDTYRVSVGRLFLLSCVFKDDDTNVTWSRAGEDGPRLPAGVEVRDGLLWFLPVQMSHDGSYTCEKRSGPQRATIGVSVSSGKCPDPPENKSLTLGVSEGVSCKQAEIFKLNNVGNIRWMKDCQLMEPPGDHISVEENGLMRMSAASKEDAGIYTCLVDVSVDGRTYTAARSIRLTADKNITDTVLPEPIMEYPQGEVVVVEEGTSVKLKCSAYIGYSEDSETLMYWTVNETESDEHEELKCSWNFVHEGGRVYGRSILSISKVRRRFLNVPIYCWVSNPAGQTNGIVWLKEADHSAFYTLVAVGLSAPLAVLLLAAAILVFKVDLVLAHRKLMRRFSKQAPDGKLYDAYVSFLPADALSSAETASLVLQILPEKLERQHGYSLYIRGRDDCPGEAVHDVIAATVRKCRRLIIILSPEVKSTADGKTEEVPLCTNENQLSYEQKVGLYDALTQNDPRVILVEIDGPVDYSRLPESLRYFRRKQGALKWKRTSLRTNKLHKLLSNRNFWKNLRYHMPPVPVGRLQTAV